MENKSFIDELFEKKEEDLYEVTPKDKLILKEIKDNSVNLEDILNLIKNSNVNYKDFLEKIESYLDDINIESSYWNQKSYKSGFIDGVRLMIECLEK